MKYIKRIITAMAFLAGLLVLLYFSSKIFMPKNNTEAAGMEYESANGILGEKEDSIDVLFLGDSECYSSIIPLQIWNDAGITSYNCSNPAQQLSYAYVMLQRACRSQTPKVVFLEINEVFRTQRVANLLFDELCEHLPVFRYHDRWKQIKPSELGKTADYTACPADKGYVYNTATNPSEKPEPPIPTKEKDKISLINVEIVKAMKRYCDSIGAKFVLVSIPSTLNWNYKRHNGISNLAEEIGCEFIDLNLMNEQINIEWDKDTSDKGDHLNYRGASKVTKHLTEYLVTTTKLQSHKGDEKYSDWDESYKKFQEKVQKG